MPDSASPLPKHGPVTRTDLGRDLVRRAVRQVALLRAASAALAYAPTLDDRIGTLERAREELLQLEQVALSYAELTGADLLSEVELRLVELSVPSSWLEATLTQLLLCVATRVELEAQPELIANGTISGHALARETEQMHAARATLCELAPSDADTRKLAPHLRRWLVVALDTLIDDDVRRAYLKALAHEMEPVGMRITH